MEFIIVALLICIVVRERYYVSKLKQKECALHALKKKLKRSDEDLDNLAHVASHDLRTPLRGITSFLQLYVRKNRTRFDDTDKEYLQFISSSAKQMDNLIQSLLFHSSIDRHKIAPKPINLNKIRHSVHTNLRRFVLDRRVHIVVSPLPTIVAHDFLIQKLFQNIIENALKYNKSQIPTAEVFTINNTEGGLIFAIRDNGIGISDRYKDIVFKIFQRLNAVDAYDGSGIGLATCKRIVDLYGGKIWFDSNDLGTTFYFTLPACPVVEVPVTKEIMRHESALAA